jgi:hypothetical protein
MPEKKIRVPPHFTKYEGKKGGSGPLLLQGGFYRQRMIFSPVIKEWQIKKEN